MEFLAKADFWIYGVLASVVGSVAFSWLVAAKKEWSSTMPDASEQSEAQAVKRIASLWSLLTLATALGVVGAVAVLVVVSRSLVGLFSDHSDLVVSAADIALVAFVASLPGVVGGVLLAKWMLLLSATSPEPLQLDSMPGLSMMLALGWASWVSTLPLWVLAIGSMMAWTVGRHEWVTPSAVVLAGAEFVLHLPSGFVMSRTLVALRVQSGNR